MDWIAAALIIISIVMIGRKNKWGWLVATAGAALYLIVSYKKQIYGFVALDCVLLVLDVVNFFKWGKNKLCEHKTYDQDKQIKRLECRECGHRSWLGEIKNLYP